MAKRAGLVTLYADARVHAVDKPAGISTVSERWHRELPTVINELWKEWRRADPDAPRPHVVHRLVKDTTGVLIFARDRDAQAELRRQFRAREVQKSYLALVRGTPRPASGIIEIRIDASPSDPGRMSVVSHGGKECSTRYECIEEFGDLAVVRLEPLTGRTHQIRVSLAHIGCPCVVDPKYGGSEALYLSSIKRGHKLGKDGTESPLIRRLTLHAESLTVRHPESGAELRIEAPLPKDLAAALKQLRRWSLR